MTLIKSVLYGLTLAVITFGYSHAHDTLLTYTELIQLPGATKVQLCSRALYWFNDTFKSQNDLLQVNDQEPGELSGKEWTITNSNKK